MLMNVILNHLHWSKIIPNSSHIRIWIEYKLSYIILKKGRTTWQQLQPIFQLTCSQTQRETNNKFSKNPECSRNHTQTDWRKLGSINETHSVMFSLSLLGWLYAKTVGQKQKLEVPKTYKRKRLFKHCVSSNTKTKKNIRKHQNAFVYSHNQKHDWKDQSVNAVSLQPSIIAFEFVH